MQEDTTKIQAEWKGRIQYIDKIPFLQVWFSSMLSPLVPTGFYLELKGSGLSTSEISYFAILPTSSLMLSSPVSPPLHYSHSLFSSFMSNPFLSAQAKQGLLLCSHSLSQDFNLSVSLRHVIPLLQVLLSFFRLHSCISTPSLNFSLKIQVCCPCLLSSPTPSISFLLFPHISFPFLLQVSLRFFLVSKSDLVHLYQFKSKIKKLVHCLFKMYSSNFLLDARKLYNLEVYFILANSLWKHFNYQWMYNLHGCKNTLR